jgi:hypothetical protein
MKVVCVLLVAAVSLAAATQADAQFRRGGSRGSQGSAKSDSGAQANRVDQLEQLLEELREDLKLQPPQQAAWDAYADKVRELSLDIARDRSRAQEQAKAPALKQLDHTVDVARNRLTALEDIAAAASTLYKELSPEQRSIADPRLATVVPAVSLSGPPAAPGRSGPRGNPQ